MATFSQLANAEFDLTHLWRAFLSDSEGATSEDELIYCSEVDYPTSIVSLSDDMLNIGIPTLKDPDVSLTIYCPRNKNAHKFNEEFFKKWADNNYDESTGANNIFCNLKVLTIQRLSYGQTIENAEWKPSFSAYVVPIGTPNFTGESSPNFRQMKISFKKIWGCSQNYSKDNKDSKS